MTYQTLEQEAAARNLTVLGGFHPMAEDNAPEGCKTLLMLGPDEPDFWNVFMQTPEWQDGKADPMDRWSTRVIGDWANTIGAEALYPFGGAPFLPFFSWALRTGRLHASPINFLVHDRAGLFVSFRGALALTEHIDLPSPGPAPCDSCVEQPCRTACLSGALTPDGYDVPTCRSFLDTTQGAINLTSGCAVRRSCPVSQDFGRLPAQSAYHMQQFKGS